MPSEGSFSAAFYRRCERSEAIHCHSDGLLRCARNDECCKVIPLDAGRRM
jgi:hypothetical protein